VVATDIGSTAWQLRDGAGIVVEPADVEALSRAIARVLGDRTLQSQLSRRGIEVARQHTYELQSAGIADFVRRLADTGAFVL
jgi:glycosyltransferase involved in cell wall biosynthesis